MDLSKSLFMSFVGVGIGALLVARASAVAHDIVNRWLGRSWFGITQMPDLQQREKYERFYRVLSRVVGVGFIVRGLRTLLGS